MCLYFYLFAFVTGAHVSGLKIHVAEDDLELQFLLPLLSSLFGVGDGTMNLLYARQALYYLSHTLQL